MNSEKYQNDIILGDSKMQREYVAFPCKEYIFMQAKVPCPWTNSFTLHSRERCYSVDWLGNSPDLPLIEEARNNMKINLVYLQECFGLIIATYGTVFLEKVL